MLLLISSYHIIYFLPFPTFTLKWIYDVIKKMKLAKAPGTDSISEGLKEAHDNYWSDKITKLLNE